MFQLRNYRLLAQTVTCNVMSLIHLELYSEGYIDNVHILAHDGYIIGLHVVQKLTDQT